MGPFEALHGRKCRFPVGWLDVSIIRDRLNVDYCRKKSYADYRIKVLEFEESYKVYFRISPM